MEVHNMIRFRISFLLLFIFATVSGEDAPKTTNELMDTLVNLLNKSPDQDLTASASEYRAPRGISGPFRGKNCYDCNSEPWIPIVGRSINFQPSSHSNNIGHFYFNDKFAQPPIDQYGAPQASFQYPGAGEVVDFMLPPPYKSGSLSSLYGAPSFNYGPPKPEYRPPTLQFGSFGPPKPQYGPPRLQYIPPRQEYGPPRPQYKPLAPSFSTIIDLSPPPLHGLGQTMHLKPLTDIVLPLENNLPAAQPSDSYGRPLGLSDSYSAPSTKTHIEPITLSSNDYGNHVAFESQYSSEIASELYQKGLTDVQVVPSLRIADYTASIEHPINLIQSPILDVNAAEDASHNSEEQAKLSEKPIVVEDTFTSASDINTTYSSGLERPNDKYLSPERQSNKLTENLIQKLLSEHNIIEDPSNQIVGIQKSVVNPNNVLTDFNVVKPSWLPPKKTWLKPVNETFSHAIKSPKKLQIIVPYLKAPAPSTAIYNREYTTLAPVFVPPPLTTESGSLWTQLVDELRTGETQKESAHGFLKSTTEVYNIHDYFSKKSNYDGKSLQKNIDDWTHQSYSDRHLGKFTKLAHAKNIPGAYFNTTMPNLKDHLASGSDHQDVISNEIEENFILPEVTTQKPPSSSTFPTIKFVEKSPKPSWDENKVTLRNSTHEKVYLVTPQSYVRFLTSTPAPATAFSMAPKIQNGQVNNATTMTRISVRVESPAATEQTDQSKDVKVIFSEWPHLINDLETTTTTKPTSRHPLFGLMDMAAYTSEPNNLTVQTLSGHSKVVSFGTSPLIRITSTTPLPKVNLNDTVKISPVTL